MSNNDRRYRRNVRWKSHKEWSGRREFPERDRTDSSRSQSNGDRRYRSNRDYNYSPYAQHYAPNEASKYRYVKNWQNPSQRNQDLITNHHVDYTLDSYNETEAFSATDAGAGPTAAFRSLENPRMGFANSLNPTTNPAAVDPFMTQQIISAFTQMDRSSSGGSMTLIDKLIADAAIQMLSAAASTNATTSLNEPIETAETVTSSVTANEKPESSKCAVEIATSKSKTVDQAAVRAADSALLQKSAEQVTKKLINELSTMSKYDLKQIIHNPAGKYETALNRHAQNKLRAEVRKQLKNFSLNTLENPCSNNGTVEADEAIDASKIPAALLKQIGQALDLDFLDLNQTNSAETQEPQESVVCETVTTVEGVDGTDLTSKADNGVPVEEATSSITELNKCETGHTLVDNFILDSNATPHTHSNAPGSPPPVREEHVDDQFKDASNAEIVLGSSDELIEPRTSVHMGSLRVNTVEELNKRLNVNVDYNAMLNERAIDELERSPYDEAQMQLGEQVESSRIEHPEMMDSSLLWPMPTATGTDTFLEQLDSHSSNIEDNQPTGSTHLSLVHQNLNEKDNGTSSMVDPMKQTESNGVKETAKNNTMRLATSSLKTKEAILKYINGKTEKRDNKIKGKINENLLKTQNRNKKRKLNDDPSPETPAPFPNNSSVSRDRCNMAKENGPVNSKYRWRKSWNFESEHRTSLDNSNNVRPYAIKTKPQPDCSTESIENVPGDRRAEPPVLDPTSSGHSSHGTDLTSTNPPAHGLVNGGQRNDDFQNKKRKKYNKRQRWCRRQEERLTSNDQNFIKLEPSDETSDCNAVMNSSPPDVFQGISQAEPMGNSPTMHAAVFPPSMLPNIPVCDQNLENDNVPDVNVAEGDVPSSSPLENSLLDQNMENEIEQSNIPDVNVADDNGPPSSPYENSLLDSEQNDIADVNILGGSADNSMHHEDNQNYSPILEQGGPDSAILTSDQVDSPIASDHNDRSGSMALLPTDQETMTEPPSVSEPLKMDDSTSELILPIAQSGSRLKHELFPTDVRDASSHSPENDELPTHFEQREKTLSPRNIVDYNSQSIAPIDYNRSVSNRSDTEVLSNDPNIVDCNLSSTDAPDEAIQDSKEGIVIISSPSSAGQNSFDEQMPGCGAEDVPTRDQNNTEGSVIHPQPVEDPTQPTEDQENPNPMPFSNQDSSQQHPCAQPVHAIFAQMESIDEQEVNLFKRKMEIDAKIMMLNSERMEIDQQMVRLQNDRSRWMNVLRMGLRNQTVDLSNEPVLPEAAPVELNAPEPCIPCPTEMQRNLQTQPTGVQQERTIRRITMISGNSELMRIFQRRRRPSERSVEENPSFDHY